MQTQKGQLDRLIASAYPIIALKSPKLTRETPAKVFLSHVNLGKGENSINDIVIATLIVGWGAGINA